MSLVRVPAVRLALLACVVVWVVVRVVVWVVGWVGACGAERPGAGQTERQATPVPAVATPLASAGVGSRDDLADALGVLRAWDARRAAAWRDRDHAALRALYVRGSSAPAADIALLRAYADRGLAVRRLETQVFAAEVLHRSPSVVRLRVHDRTSASVQSGAGTETVRASDPVQRVLELRRVGGRWRMVSVSGG